MGVVLLDTTVLVDALRGRPVVDRLRRLRSQRDTAATTAINVEEIYRGMRAREASAVRLLFSGLYVLPIAAADAERAGQWRRTFAEKGTTLSQADCLIAAVAVGVSAVLATGNVKDFPMPDLVVEHWPVGG